MAIENITKVDNEYSANQIDSLEGLEPIRKRPGMYIGSTSQKGVTHLIWEVTDNCFDEYMAGYGNEIDIHVYKDATVKVIDRGRGIPVGPHPKWKNPDGTPMDTLTGILTKIHAGGKFGGDSGYKCFTADSIVKTPNGYYKIEELKPGHFVINAFNEIDEIKNVFSYDYEGKVNTIILENGKEVSAIDGHYILVQRDEKLYWIEIENIVKTDMLIELEEDDDIEELKRSIPKYEMIKY